MSTANAAPKTAMQRFLDGVEKGGEHGSPSGRHLPDPDRHRHRAVGAAEPVRRGGHLRAHQSGHASDRDRDHRDPQPAERRRHPLHVRVAHSQLHELHRGRADDRRDDRRRRRGGIGPGHGADPQARHRLAGLGADLHPGLRRHPREHRRGCRLSGPDPARRHRLPGRRAPSAGRPGARLRRRGRRLHRQHADQAARCGARRVHQRRGPSRRPQPVDRPGLERLVLDRVGAVPDGGHRLHHRPHDRAAPGHLRSRRSAADGTTTEQGATLSRAGIARPALRRLRPARPDRRLLPADAARPGRRCAIPTPAN